MEQVKYLTDEECEKIETINYGGDGPTICSGGYPDFYNTSTDELSSEIKDASLRKKQKLDLRRKRISTLIERALNQYENISRRLQAVPKEDTDALIKLADRAIIHDKRLGSLLKLLEE